MSLKILKTDAVNTASRDEVNIIHCIVDCETIDGDGNDCCVSNDCIGTITRPKEDPQEAGSGDTVRRYDARCDNVCAYFSQ